MEEDKVCAVNFDLVITNRRAVPTQVPRRKIYAGGVTDYNAAEEFRPPIQVLLVRISLQFDSVVTPFDALLTPPRKAFQRFACTPKSEQSDIEPAHSLEVLQFRWKTVFDDKHGITSQQFEDRVRPGEEEQIRV